MQNEVTRLALYSLCGRNEVSEWLNIGRVGALSLNDDCEWVGGELSSGSIIFCVVTEVYCLRALVCSLVSHDLYASDLVAPTVASLNKFRYYCRYI